MDTFLSTETPKLVQKYQAQVSKLNDNYLPNHLIRCSACNGVETIRGLPQAEPYDLGTAFGAASAALYEEGIPSNVLVAADGVNRVNAHAVIARANFESGMRLGLCELVARVGAANPVVNFRAGTALLPDRADNRGRDFRQALQNVSAGWTATTIEDTRATEIVTALVGAQARVSTEVAAADGRTALLRQQCAVARAFTLAHLRTAARASAPPDLGAFFTNRMQTLLVYGNGGVLNLAQTPIAVSSFAQDLRTDNTVGPTVIDKIGLTWATIRTVEFGSQCAPCELNQGTLDMCGRFDTAITRYSADKSGVRANPVVGVAFSGLSFGAGSTVWDLSNSLIAVALNQVYQTLVAQAKQAQSGTPTSTLLDGLTQLMTAAPSLTTAYFQCLFLELAYGNALKVLS
jgi:hypothetical protein